MIHLHRVDSDKLNHSSPTLTSLGECYLQPASLYSVKVEFNGSVRWLQLGDKESLRLIFIHFLMQVIYTAEYPSYTTTLVVP